MWAFLQANNIHVATYAPGKTHATLPSLRANAVSTRQKARFYLATDGERFGRRRRQVWAESRLAAVQRGSRGKSSEQPLR